MKYIIFQFEFDLSLTSINEKLSPCYTIRTKRCHLVAGINVQERTSSPETEVPVVSEKPELHRELESEGWILEGQTKSHSQT